MGKLEIYIEVISKWGKYNCHKIRREIEKFRRNNERVCLHVDA